jgi:hypothetical protein
MKFVDDKKLRTCKKCSESLDLAKKETKKKKTAKTAENK